MIFLVAKHDHAAGGDSLRNLRLTGSNNNEMWATFYGLENPWLVLEYHGIPGATESLRLKISRHTGTTLLLRKAALLLLLRIPLRTPFSKSTATFFHHREIPTSSGHRSLEPCIL
jgi:hypothetical protein